KKKNKDNENEVPIMANVSYIANIIGVTRVHASRMMNALKEKGVLATAETGMRTDDGRPCTARTWFVNPNLVYCGDKNKIDTTVQLIFKDTLKNIKDENGKKIELPIRLFI
ncbi:TPA: helix-turn-helix domain-containing protein, partial [Bacillus paranthracis]